MMYLPTVGAPVIKTAAGTVYTLASGILEYEIEKDQELLKSVITGARAVLDRGTWFGGEIDYFQPANLAEYAALKALKGATVRLWPFGAGTIPNANPLKWYPYVDVILVDVKPYHRKSKYYLDALILSFESAAEYTLTWANDDGMGAGT